MSDNLKKVAAKLIKFSKLPRKDIGAILKRAPRRLVKALSEIAYNAREGVLKICDKVKNSKVSQILADKYAKLKEKKAILCTVVAPMIIQMLIIASIEVLNRLCNHG